MRPEQEEAVRRTKAYFEQAKKADPDRNPKFLWNAKMRFGKTFAAYQIYNLCIPNAYPEGINLKS